MRYKSFFIIAVVAIAAAFPLFMRLDVHTLREWDEARNAINAYEMSESGNYLVKTYNGEPDLWETKPPLLIWLQVACFKLLGYNELAVRLPSALAGMALVIFILLFTRRHLGTIIIGIVAVGILITSPGFIGDHCTRTGDHDALLLLFEILFLLSFFLYSESGNKSALWIAALGFALSIITKSIAVFMLLPGLLCYLIFTSRFIQVVKDRHFWLAFIVALIPVALFYFLREQAAPGYLKAVWNNELFPRYFNKAENYTYEKADFWYYFQMLSDKQFGYWLLFIIPAAFINHTLGNERQKLFNLFLIISAVVFLIIISWGTGNSQYDLILLPIFSLLIGLGIYLASINLQFTHQIKKEWRMPLRVVALALLFVLPYSHIISKVFSRTESSTEVQYGYVIKMAEKQLPTLKEFKVYKPSPANYPLVFYKKIFNEKKGYSIVNADSASAIDNGEYVLILKDKLAELNKAGFKSEVALQFQDCSLVKVNRDDD